MTYRIIHGLTLFNIRVGVLVCRQHAAQGFCNGINETSSVVLVATKLVHPSHQPISYTGQVGVLKVIRLRVYRTV